MRMARSELRFVVFIIAISIFVKEVSTTCRNEECANWFQKTKEYENLQPSSTERYCQVLGTYLKCLNDTLRFCHGRLGFHSGLLVMGRLWRDYNCSKFKNESREDKLSEGVANEIQTIPVNTCYFNPPPSHRKIKFCSLFGDPHLIRFDGSLETCSEEGARPLVDNRYFLVQVTNKNVRGEALTTTVSKVTVIIRKHNCTSSLRYEASADEPHLPRGFVDGSTFQKAGHNTDKNSVEVLWQEENSVEISLHFIHSSIHIRRQGPYLSVSIKSPSNVLETGENSDKHELCWSGCRKKAKISMEDAFSAPNEFARCFARKIHVPIRIAEDRCRDVGTTDLFFDSCVFDLMLTGDDYLVSLAHSIQLDVHRLAPHHVTNQIFRHRNQLRPLAGNLPIFTTQCLSPSSSYSNFSIFISIIIVILAIIIPTST